MKTWHELSLEYRKTDMRPCDIAARNESRCPLWDRIISFMISAVLVLNITTYTTVIAVDASVEDMQPKPAVITNAPVSTPDSKSDIKPEPAL